MLRSICSAGLLVIVTGSLPACGSGGPSPLDTAPFTSGLTKTESLGDLRNDDVASLCSSLRKYIASDEYFTEAMCRPAGFEAAAAASLVGHPSDAALRKICTDAHDPCIEARLATASCTRPSSTCSATVAELETCVADFADTAKNTFLSIVPCSMLIQESFEVDASQGPPKAMKLPASCQQLEEKCPGVTISIGLASGSVGGS